MSIYNIVPDSINRLADRVDTLARNKSRHQENMGQINLAGSRLGLEAKTLADQNRLMIAKAERDKKLDEPTTFARVIETSDMPDDQKAQILKSFDEKVLNFPTTRRKAFDAFQKLEAEKAAAMRDAAERGSKEKIASERNQTMLDIADKNIAAAGKRASQTASEKDTRSTMEKEVEFIHRTTGKPMEEALVDWQRSKSLPERIRLFNNELDAINEDISLMGEDSGKIKAQKIEELRAMYGINDAVQGVQSQVPTQAQQPQISLPNNITKTSEAMQFLTQEQGMDEEQAKAWLINMMGVKQ